MTVKKGDPVIKGFEGDNPPEDFHFPSIGIEDIDRAVFKLFDERLRFQVTQKKETKKVPVVFASGERFALTRRKNPIRDKNNALILPLISIMRTGVDFSPSQKNKSTAISFREQPSYTIARRLSKEDRAYQNIVNKSGITNQKNTASKKNVIDTSAPIKDAKPGRVSTRRSIPSKLNFNAGSLEPDIKNNIFEIIEIPYPEFITLSYEVTFWTQYITQANEMMETLIFNFDGQGEEIVMKTEAGFELVAFFEQSFTNSSNFDNYSDEERVIKNSINLSVPGYILNPKHPGLPNLARSYFSAPVIEFGYVESSQKVVVNNQPEQKPERVQKNVLSDLTNTEEIKEEESKPAEVIEDRIINPFTGEEVVKFSKIRSRNQRAGETVASSLIMTDIEIQNE